MANDGQAKLLRVFLASPGDVGEERAFVRHYLESVLPKNQFLPHPVRFDVVSWDDPDASVPMPAHLTPQEAVIRFKRAPAECDIVIVILWGRLGTHLDPTALSKPDGGRYLSGTEWEYENAFNARPRPDILVYRRSDRPSIDLGRGPARDQALEQLDRVDDFVGRFKNEDGSWKGGFSEYSGLEAFKKKLANDLEHIVADRLNYAGTVPPDPSAATIPLPDRCFGRDDDTKVLVAALVATGSPTAVLVQGPGGIGKTTLTQQAANHDQVVARFGARRWFVELETATDRDTFDAAILLTLGLDATLGFDAALSRLAQNRSLLVLDNLETPWGGDPPAIERRLAQLATVPGLAVLASFRGDEAVGGVRWSLRHTVHALPLDDAKALFFDIAQRIPGNDPHLSELLAALGGVPLAINLAARRAARHNSLAELWAEWAVAGTAVARLPGAVPSRLTSVPQSIEFSLRSPLMTEAGHRLFRLLGQLPAGIADEDRRALLGSDAFTAREQVQGVGLAFMHAGRLDLLPPVRDHARRAHPPQDADATWFRHYLTMAKLGDRIGFDDGDGAMQRLVPELPNLDAAIDATITNKTLESAIAAAFGLSKTLRFSGLGSSSTLESLADASASAGDTSGEASCLERLGDIALARSDHKAARAHYTAARPLYRSVAFVLGEANCIKGLGDIELARSDHEVARSRYEEALSMFRRQSDVVGEANCIQRLGDIALARSDHETARSRYEAAVPLYRRIGNLLGEAGCIWRLGDIARVRLDHDAARSRYEEALPLYRRVGSVLGEANCIKGLGDIALTRLDHDTARSRYEEALPLYSRVGEVVGEAGCALGYGDVANARMDRDMARVHFNEALELCRRVHKLDGVALAHERLATITAGAERAEHVHAAKQAWTTIKLPGQAARVDQTFR